LPLASFAAADLSVDYSADQNRVAEAEQRTPGSLRVNVHLRSNQLRVGGAGISLVAGVDNLFDRSWRRHLSTLRGLIISEPGRNVFVRLRVLW
ncbi:MAG: TonB-dependent receptor, partial [Bacteroidetes bacterium]|nr:TonB-dependent receptor [Bacteroidota bacterium]